MRPPCGEGWWRILRFPSRCSWLISLRCGVRRETYRRLQRETTSTNAILPKALIMPNYRHFTNRFDVHHSWFAVKRSDACDAVPPCHFVVLLSCSQEEPVRCTDLITSKSCGPTSSEPHDSVLSVPRCERLWRTKRFCRLRVPGWAECPRSGLPAHSGTRSVGHVAYVVKKSTIASSICCRPGSSSG